MTRQNKAAAIDLPLSAVPSAAETVAAVTEEVLPAVAPAPTPPRKTSPGDETVARHQKSLAEALAMALAIKYDQPPLILSAEAAGKKTAKSEKAGKVKKTKLVRDSYALPESEYLHLGELKKRLGALGNEVRKSELLRGGIALLAALNDEELLAVMARVERIKTGRPAKNK